MDLLMIAIVGYLVGSVPFALVIGKVFFRTDIRNYGSGNLGGGNTGRVLGKKAGLAVMTLDILKATLVVWLATLLSEHPWAVCVGGLCTAIGHCYPVFAAFKGGKAVATLYGFLFGLWVVEGYSPMVFFLPLVTFLVVLYLGKIVALASIVSAVAAVIWLWWNTLPVPVIGAAGIFAVLILVRHRKNLTHMAQGTENKIRWM